MEIYISTLLSVITIIITVGTTLYTVNKRVENENRETHKPYLILDKIVKLDDINPTKYYLTMYGRNYLSETKKKDQYLALELLVKNIGYGVATNIKFYNLLNGEEILGTQESNQEENQKLFTTLDIGIGEDKKIPAKVMGGVITKHHEVSEEHNRILCIYKDLNEHIYTFIFCINIKESTSYDYFAYQPSSKSYKRWIKENHKQYQKILKSYKE